MAEHPRGYSHDLRSAAPTPPPPAEAAPVPVAPPIAPVDDPAAIDRQFGGDLHEAPPAPIALPPQSTMDAGSPDIDDASLPPDDQADLDTDQSDVETADLTEIAQQVVDEADGADRRDPPIAEPDDTQA